MRRLLLLLLVLFSLLRVETYAQRISLTLNDYPPYMGAHIPYQGILSRLVKEAFALEGVDITLVEVPNNRSIAGPMAGLYDGTFGWAYTQERAEKLLYSDALLTFHMVFFQRKDRIIDWQTMEDLAPYAIGITKGNFVSNDFSRLQQEGRLRVDEGLDDPSGMRKLLLQRIDLFPMEKEAGQYLLASLFQPGQQRQIAVNSHTIWEVPVHLLIYRGHPQAADLISRFNRGLAKLKQSGQYERLILDTRAAILKAASLSAP